MKKINWIRTALLHGFSLVAAMSLAALPAAATSPLALKRSAPIPTDQLGAIASQQYQGDGLSVVATPDGARLRCNFQRLEGQATSEGLWLNSTVEDLKGELFRVMAVAVERETEKSSFPTFLESFTSGGLLFALRLAPLAHTGSVTVTATRPSDCGDRAACCQGQGKIGVAGVFADGGGRVSRWGVGADNGSNRRVNGTESESVHRPLARASSAWHPLRSPGNCHSGKVRWFGDGSNLHGCGKRLCCPPLAHGCGLLCADAACRVESSAVYLFVALPNVTPIPRAQHARTAFEFQRWLAGCFGSDAVPSQASTFAHEHLL